MVCYYITKIRQVLSLKKVILGTGLIICGVLGILNSILIEAIYFASPNAFSQRGTDPFLVLASIILFIGIIFTFWGFMDNDRP